uniref:transcription factor bHLH30-like n=1 Tax=Erigeron canadensis TaxID=72917 RepID=UPI001CB8E722|nr:transcription factor bHLH30-like [Erigeron canadensis]
MFLPSSSSQIIPLIMHNHHHPSSWTTLLRPQSFHHHTTTAYNRVLQCPTGDHDPFLLPPQPQTTSPSSCSSSQRGLFKRVVDGLQFAYEGTTTTTTSPSIDTSSVVPPGLILSSSVDPFGMHIVETSKTNMSAQDIVEAKAIAASKSHSEAERRRRERINNHLTKLRTLLPNTTKTDKASLLAEVIQHLKELKHQTSIIAKQSLVPTEMNELTIDNTLDEEGRIVIKASLCCEDRSDLLPDLIKTLKMLRLRTLKAEITTLGRRVKNVLFVTSEEDPSMISNDNNQTVNHWISLVEEALQAVVETTDNNMNDYSSSFTGVKRQRTNNNIGIY